MRKLPLLMTAALALAACAPSMSPATPPAELAAALARGATDPATLTLAQGPQRVLVAAGDKTLYLSALVISGASLRYNDTRCAITGRAEITCTYDGLEVPGGKRFGQPIGGTDVHVTALYRRALDGPLLAKAF